MLTYCRSHCISCTSTISSKAWEEGPGLRAIESKGADKGKVEHRFDVHGHLASVPYAAKSSKHTCSFGQPVPDGSLEVQGGVDVTPEVGERLDWGDGDVVELEVRGSVLVGGGWWSTVITFVFVLKHIPARRQVSSNRSIRARRAPICRATSVI